MLRGLSLLGLGAGLMYMLDPERGTSRRALLRDKAIGMADSAVDGLEVATRDLNHRTLGMVSELRGRWNPVEVTDDLLVQRVRSKLGRWVSHPHAIQVKTENGKVTLMGPILRHEVDPLIVALMRVPGVHEVENAMEVHDTAEHVPSLQGGEPRMEVPELSQEEWASAVRLLAGAGGGLLAVSGLARRGIVGTLLSIAGAGLLVRAASNRSLQNLIGAAGGHRGIVVQKTIILDAPIEQVFDLWDHPESFPRFMDHVLEVRSLGEGRHHWVVAGPAGVPVEWDSVITQRDANRLIAWKSTEDQLIEHAGLVHFEPAGETATRVNLRMTYHPPGGVLGHAVANFFRADPKHEMDIDFVRVKQLLESGATRP